MNHATDRRVLFFGDSFVAGVGDPTGLGWVGRCVAASFAAGVPLTAYGLGVRGQTSVAVAARWRAEARARLAAGADARVVFSFGSNDAALERGRPRIAAARSAEALEGVLDDAMRLGLRAFVVGPPPVGDAAHDERIAVRSEAFAARCARRDVPFVSVVDALCACDPWTSEAAVNDGSHPGARGYEALAQLVLAAGWIDWLR